MPKKEYSIGDQVEHKLFGKGTILAVDGVEIVPSSPLSLVGRLVKRSFQNT